MKKRFSRAKFAFVSILSLGLVSLAACGSSEGHVIQPEEKNIVSIKVKEGTIPEEIFIGYFDQAGITLVVSYSDNTSEEVKVTTQMIPEKYREYLNVEGEYDVTFIYRGEAITIHIKMVVAHYLVNFYAYVDSPEYTLISTQDIRINQDAIAPYVEENLYYEGMHYTFKEWDSVFTNITAAKNVYAQYDSIEYYVVNFYNGNDELIDSQNVDKGDDAVEPSEALRSMPGYEFVGWDRNYTNVTSNLNIYGLYVNVSAIDNNVTIVFASSFNDTYQAIINAAAEELMSQYDTITVINKKMQGSYDDVKEQVINGVVDGSYPDMVVSYPDSIIDYFNAGIALDITNQMNNPNYGFSQSDRDDFFDPFLSEGNNYPVSGTYSMPLAKSTEAMYYNQDVLVGLDLSDVNPSINNGNPLTDAYIQNLSWEELFENLIPALEVKDNQLKQGGNGGLIDKSTFDDWAWVGYDSDDNFFYTLAEQYGYGHTAINKTTGEGQILFNNENMKNLMNKFKGYYSNHYFTTKGIIQTNVNYRFTTDAMLFSIGATGGVKYQFSSDNPHNIGVAPIPHPEGKGKKSILQGPSVAFLNHNDPLREKAAWLFYKLLTSFKYNVQWATTTGYAPIRRSVVESAEYQEYSDYASLENHTLDKLYALNASFQANICDYLYSTPVFQGSNEVRVQIGTIFPSIVNYSNIDTVFSSVYQQSLVAVKQTADEPGISILNKADFSSSPLSIGKKVKLKIAINPAVNILSSLYDGTLRITSSNNTIAQVKGKYVFLVGEGNARITVSYQGMTDYVETNGYNETPKMKYGTVHEGTVEDPFDNADACKAGHYIKDNDERMTAETDLYIKGTVASFYHAPGSRTDGAVSWFLEKGEGDTEQFEIYKAYKDDGKGGKVALTVDDIWVGAEVLCHGPITFYNNQMETSYAWLDKVEGDKPEPPTTIDSAVAEAITVGQGLVDGDQTYDFYNVTGYVVRKSGMNYFMADTQTVDSSVDNKALFELYGISDAAEQAKLLKGAKVTVKMKIKNYHGQIENGNTPEITILEAGQPWTIN